MLGSSAFIGNSTFSSLGFLTTFVQFLFQFTIYNSVHAIRADSLPKMTSLQHIELSKY